METLLGVKAWGVIPTPLMYIKSITEETESTHTTRLVSAEYNHPDMSPHAPTGRGHLPKERNYGSDALSKSIHDHLKILLLSPRELYL